MASSNPSKDEIRTNLAVSIAKARQQQLISKNVIDQLMARVKKELFDNMVRPGPDGKLVMGPGLMVPGPDGQPLMSERGIPLVPDSTITQLVEFKKGLIQLDLGLAVGKKLTTLADSAEATDRSAEMIRLAKEIENVQAESTVALQKAVTIFQQACFGGPLSEAEMQKLKDQMDKLGQDTVNRMLAMIAAPDVVSAGAAAGASASGADGDSPSS